MIYIFSDGYADQFGGEKGHKYMSKNLHNELLNISSLPETEQYNHLKDTINNWMNYYEPKYDQIDDIIVVGVRF